MRNLPILLVLALGWGCSPSTPVPGNPDEAKLALVLALDSWKRGDKIDSLRELSPPVVVTDSQWQKGAKLLSYEIVGDPTSSGLDHAFKVKLSVQTTQGKKTAENVSYTVSTTKARVVLRTEIGS